MHLTKPGNMQIISILVLSAIATVLSKKCYSTDTDALETGRRVTHKLKDCEKYIEESIQKFGFNMQTETTMLMNNFNNTKCFKTQVKVKKDAPIDDFVIKGCVPKGGCTLVKDTIEKRAAHLNMSQYISSINCSECDEEKCNK